MIGCWYPCKCPACGYRYQVVSRVEQDWEICPKCGYSKPFSEFVERKLNDRVEKVPN